MTVFSVWHIETLELSAMAGNQHPASFCGFMVSAMLLLTWPPQWTGWRGCDSRRSKRMDVILVCPISYYISIKFVYSTRKLLGFRFYQAPDTWIFWGCSLLSWSLPYLSHCRSWQGLVPMPSIHQESGLYSLNKNKKNTFSIKLFPCKINLPNKQSVL